jgi:hypothetical protein
MLAHLDFWDYLTFASLFIVGAACGGAALLVLGLPGKIAIARKHPDADAVNLMGWVGFLAVVPWIQALIQALNSDSSPEVRLSAVKGLEVVGVDSESALQALKNAAANDSDPGVCQLAQAVYKRFSSN